jgi:hypothetical protein
MVHDTVIGENKAQGDDSFFAQANYCFDTRPVMRPLAGLAVFLVFCASLFAALVLAGEGYTRLSVLCLAPMLLVRFIPVRIDRRVILSTSEQSLRGKWLRSIYRAPSK